ncbi:MAG: hypothetical protein DRQ57_17990 [Gammaproteobacteria bacterium]|nr:MAG: hypothetical protein DRQ57_17990 [Gammaproteobacteria bacterium]
MLENLTHTRKRRTGRASSWDTSGANVDVFTIKPGESCVLADINGPAQITHIWCTQGKHYRECLIKITYDNAEYPSVLVPLGDFFGLGHGIVNSYQSMLFSASANVNNVFNAYCALNAYVPMPFRERAVVELVNESDEEHKEHFYIDYETLDEVSEDLCYFHSEFRRTNPFGGWGDGMSHVGGVGAVANKEKFAWDNNYVVLETKGRGHYIGCNLSVTNFYGGWWGEGDDMIWVDGYKWPPDIHGTGTEDLFNQAVGMQDNAFMRSGSSIYESNTTQWDPHIASMGLGPNKYNGKGGYQTAYVQHIENPVYFQEEIKVTIEHGHANHMANDWSSVAYWYATEPTKVIDPPPVAKRMPVLKDNQGNWVFDKKNQCPGKPVRMSEEMKQFKEQWIKDGKPCPLF